MTDQERTEKMIRVLCTFEQRTLDAVDEYAAEFRARYPGVEFGRTTAIRALVIAGVATARLLAGKEREQDRCGGEVANDMPRAQPAEPSP